MMKTFIFVALLGALLPVCSDAYYQAEQGRWLSRDPAGEVGGYNINNFIENDGINKFDLLGLMSDCECFIQNLLDAASSMSADELQDLLWDQGVETPDGVEGFDPELTGEGQGTDVYRHLQAAGASGMGTGFMATGAFFWDFGEVILDSIFDPESVNEDLIEMIGDAVGNEMGEILDDAMEDGLSDDELEDLTEDLTDLLCE